MSLVIPSVSSSTIHGSIVKIAQYEGNGTSGYVTFSNIPQTYQDIMVTAFTRTDYTVSPDNTHALFVNGSGAAGWSATYMTASGTTNTSATTSSVRETSATPTYGTSARSMSGNAVANAYSGTIWHLLNYKSPDAKTCIAYTIADRQTAGISQLTAAVWYNPNPITQVEIVTNGLYVAGTKIIVYGIRSVGQ